MANTPAGIAIKALPESCSDGVSANQKEKRLLTDNVFRRVNSAMLSETAISCCKSSCGESKVSGAANQRR